MKPSRRMFTIALAILAGVLLSYGLLRLKFGVFLPPTIDQNLPDAIVIAAVGILLWNRKLRGDAEKAEAARKRQVAEAAAARRVEAEPLAAGEEPASAERRERGDGENDASRGA